MLSSALLFGAASSAKKTSSKSTHPSSHKSTSTKASTSHKTSSGKSSKATVQKGSKTTTHSAGKSTSHKSSKSAASKGKHGKKAVASKPRQQAPSADRYREIQQALADRGYFNGPVDGNWNKESVDALKRFQKDQNLTSDGKISSLALIGLGLGPKYEPIGAIAAKPAGDATPNP
jgi:hypothetical protein